MKYNLTSVMFSTINDENNVFVVLDW